MTGSHDTDEYAVLKWTQHWVLIGGAWHREAWIRDARGVRFVAIPEDTAP